ncbi:MAG: MarR family transcriptional regulator [Coriobacteriales bacterium]|nr:MarR family transcriptional regulator [Coriobacteriales bacterium]
MITAKTGEVGEVMDYASEAIVRLQEMSDQCGSGALSEINRHSSGEFFLLKILSLYDGPVHPSELQRRSCTSSARVTAILGALEKKGWVARENDEQDRRRVLVSLTEGGQEQARRAIEEMNTKLKAVFNELGEHDTGEFVRILARLLEIFSKLKVM